MGDRPECVGRVRLLLSALFQPGTAGGTVAPGIKAFLFIGLHIRFSETMFMISFSED
jgi:hypothetical protein